MKRHDRRRRGLILAVCGLVLLAASGAGAQRESESAILMAVGSYGDLAVALSSASLRPLAEPAVERLNDTLTFVIKEERRFTVDWYAGRDWKYAHDYKNLLIIVDWNDGGEVVAAAQKLLGPGDLARLRTAEGGLVQLIDPYLSYQYGVLLAANDRAALKRLLERNAPRIRALVEAQNHERIRRQFRREGLRETLTSRYWSRHRFLIDIPNAYRENQVQPRGFPGIEWVRNGPTRGITLMWRKAQNPAAMLRDRAALLAMRREMGDALHHEDLSDADLQWRETKLGDLPALCLTGSWTSRELVGGGAFWCYFVADPEGGRVFCLDLLAFMPSLDEPKMPLYREMLAIAETFSLRAPHP